MCLSIDFFSCFVCSFFLATNSIRLKQTRKRKTARGTFICWPWTGSAIVIYLWFAYFYHSFILWQILSICVPSHHCCLFFMINCANDRTIIKTKYAYLEVRHSSDLEGCIKNNFHNVLIWTWFKVRLVFKLKIYCNGSSWNFTENL